jgi:hypothetical protein
MHMMKTQKTGMVVFWIGAAFMIALGFAASFSVRAAYRHLTLEEVNRTPWALDEPLFGLWASGVPLGAILAGVGVLLHV